MPTISSNGQCLANFTTGSVTSTTRTFSAAVSQGDTVVIFFGNRAGATSTLGVSGSTDSAGNTYTVYQLASSSGVRGGVGFAYSYVTNAITTSDTITLTNSTANVMSGFAFSFNYVQNAARVGATSTNSSGSTQTVSITPTADGAMFVLVNMYQDYLLGTNNATGTGFSQLNKYDNGTSMSLIADWKSLATSGAASSGGNTGSNVSYSIAGIVLPLVDLSDEDSVVTFW